MKKILSDIATLLEAKHIKSSSHDVADMLWLAAIMDDHNHSASPENRTQEEPNPNRIPGDKGTDTKPKINNNELSPQNEKEDTASSSSSNPLYLNEHKDSGDKKGEYKKVPTPRLYTQYNQFANVLKILRQQSLSNTEKILDEDSTIEYIANTHIWDVVTKPKCEKKFTLNIIIEKSESMEIWEEITNDFSSAVANFLFFKALNVYYLKESNKGFVLYADKKCQTKVSVNAFHSLEERHLTMLMSDCISKAWGDKRGYDFLEKITRVTPFMILNMLPKRIWKRTIVDDTWRIKFTHKVGWLNKFLISDIDEEECQVSKEHIRVPMTTFDTISLKHWSNLIAGEKENWLYGSLFEAKWFNSPSNSFEDSQSDDDPVELVKNFEIFASPMAQKLAIYFSTVPLSLDIMKIVQKVSLPESNHTHLAEVFLSGLLKKTSMRTLSDKIIYEYVDGVRDVLKEKLYQHKKENILKDNISFVAKDLGATIDFIALIENPSLENGVSPGGIDEIVAEMVVDVFGSIAQNNQKTSNITENNKNTSNTNIVIPTSKRFQMGSNEYDNEKPIHEVVINYDFEIAQYPVTFEEYDLFCEDTKRKKPDDRGWGRGNRPVINVSWHDAKEYCEWLNKKLGLDEKTGYYRLPTEAEREYSCRACTTTKWSFGDDEKELTKYAWYDDNSYSKTHPVGENLPNPWGLYDMHGNAGEWCEDDYVDNYHNTPRDGMAHVDEKADYKVLRGGSWYDDADSTRSSFRDWFNPDIRGSFNGFRLLRTLPSDLDDFEVVERKEEHYNKEINLNEVVTAEYEKPAIEKIEIEIKKLKDKNIRLGLSYLNIGDNLINTDINKKMHIIGEGEYIYILTHNMPYTITQQEVIDTIKMLNNNPHIDGVLVQLPLPKHIDTDFILNTIDPKKVIDETGKIELWNLMYQDGDKFLEVIGSWIKKKIEQNEN